MSMKDTQNKIQARVWKAIAQSELDLSSIPEADLEILVDTIVDAVVLEIDEEIDQELEEDRIQEKTESDEDQAGSEKTLWKGRPLLSISTRYVITNERLRIISGLLGKERRDIELVRIQDIDQRQTLRERLFSIGDIMIKSHDSSSPTITLNDVRDPEGVHELLRRAVISARKEHGLTFQEEM